MINIAIFASGSGSNAENTIKFFQKSKDISVKLIVSNNEDAYVHQRAKQLHVPCVYCSRLDFINTNKVIDCLVEYQIDFIILAGFLLKVPNNLLAAYPNKIVNIHPALLPKFGGKGMYGDKVHKAVLEAGETQSGITIHYVNENYDEGNILFQATCWVEPGDNYEDVAHKVHALEYEHFPWVIEKVIKETNFDKND